MSHTDSLARTIGRLAVGAVLLFSIGCGRDAMSPVQPTPVPQVSTIDGTYALRSPTVESWGIVERIDATRLFEIIGEGSGVISGSTISGSMSVGIGVGIDLRDDLLHTGCGARDHSLTFRFSRQL